MKELLKKILTYLLNKTGYFLIIDLEKIKGDNEFNHYSFNVSFFGRRKVLAGGFFNGEPMDLDNLTMWTRHLTDKEVEVIQNL